jgi:hypothetical protein
MKYVLMFTNRPDLDAATPPEKWQETYAAIFGWFTKHGSVITDSGAELKGPETATSVKTGENGKVVVVTLNPPMLSLASENGPSRARRPAAGQVHQARGWRTECRLG